MLYETLLYMVTPAPRFVRAMGYPREQIAIQGRARRHADAWAPHLAACHALIEEAMATGGRRAVVLGSGLLLEIPLQAMAERFEEVICVDLVHPPWVVRPVRRAFANVRFLAGDASGMIERFVRTVTHNRATGGMPNLPDSQPRLQLAPERCDFVVSANLLSQLSVAPCRFLQKMLGADRVPISVLDAWADGVMRAHLAWLRTTFDAPLCLFADDWRETRDRAGTVVERMRAFPEDTALPEPDREWRWDIAPMGERPDGESQARFVKGWLDIRRLD